MLQLPSTRIDRYSLGSFFFSDISTACTLFNQEERRARHFSMKDQVIFFHLLLDDDFVGSGILPADTKEAFGRDKPMEFFIPFLLSLYFALLLKFLFLELLFLL